MSDHKGKVAVVTGGARGIGRAIVTMLCEMGCRVAFSYLQSQSPAKELEESLRKKGYSVQASQVDTRDFEATKVWIQNVRQELGGLDILINNAGIIRDKALVLMEKEDWQAVLDTNLNGVFNTCRACIFTFLKQKSGVIINISSVSGLIGLARQVNYSASKGGVHAFTKALAKEVAGHGIRVNAIAPGYIETEILKDFSEEQRREMIKDIPLGRIGTPQEVAYGVRFLLSQEAGYITGQVLVVDGGLTMRS